jgi:hypothetical protein
MSAEFKPDSSKLSSQVKRCLFIFIFVINLSTGINQSRGTVKEPLGACNMKRSVIPPIIHREHFLYAWMLEKDLQNEKG